MILDRPGTRGLLGPRSDVLEVLPAVLWLWRQPSLDHAVTHWRRWYAWARRSRLEPVKRVALTVKSHITNILTYYTHRITNSAAEGINSLIDAIQRLSRGFRNQEHFKTAVYFHCGGLPLNAGFPAPRSHGRGSPRGGDCRRDGFNTLRVVSPG